MNDGLQVRGTSPTASAQREAPAATARPGEAITADSVLLEAVDHLHRELDGMRDATRLRAVIEQAKGFLVARDSLSLDDAFSRLREMSQAHNVRLVEVAATLIGANVPGADGLEADLVSEVVGRSAARSPSWSALGDDPEIRIGTAAALLGTLASAIVDPDEAAELLRTLCTPLGADSAALYRLTSERRLVEITSFGYPADVMTAWSSIPPGVDVPAMRAACRDQTIIVVDRADRDRTFPPLLTGSATADQSFVATPVHSGDGTVLGAVVVGWTAERPVPDAAIGARVERLAAVAGPVMLRHGFVDPPELRRLGVVLDVLFDPWLLLAPVESAPDRVDLRIVDASPLLPESAKMRGRWLLELWPGLALSGLHARLGRLLRDGEPWVAVISAEQSDGLPLAGETTEIRVVRPGGLLFVHWRPAATRPGTSRAGVDRRQPPDDRAH